MVVSGHDLLRNFELGWHGSLFFRGATWALAHSTYASYPSGQHSYTRGQLPGFASSVQFLASRLGHRLPASLKRSEEHTSELQSHSDLVCRLLLEKKNKKMLLKSMCCP